MGTRQVKTARCGYARPKALSATASAVRARDPEDQRHRTRPRSDAPINGVPREARLLRPASASTQIGSPASMRLNTRTFCSLRLLASVANVDRQTPEMNDTQKSMLLGSHRALHRQENTVGDGGGDDRHLRFARHGAAPPALRAPLLCDEWSALGVTRDRCRRCRDGRWLLGNSARFRGRGGGAGSAARMASGCWSGCGRPIRW
jgi:hypothetical protein